VVKRVDLAYQAFFRRVEEWDDPGYPRFFVHEEKALAKAQRRLSQAAKGTPKNYLREFIDVPSVV